MAAAPQDAQNATQSIKWGSCVNRSSIEQQIRQAFTGVTLGGGISLCHAKVADRAGDGFSDEELAGLLHPEITDDWTRVPFAELDSDCIAHLDAAGLRYYLPALMLSVLDKYVAGSMRVIGTLSALDPRGPYGEKRFTLFTEDQRSAVAAFLRALPVLVELWDEHQKVAMRSLHRYWGQYLPSSSPIGSA